MNIRLNQKNLNQAQLINSSLTVEKVQGNMAAGPTEQVVFGQRKEDPGGSDQVTHGSGDAGGVNANVHQRRPHVDVSQEAVVPLEELTGNRNKVRNRAAPLQGCSTLTPACVRACVSNRSHDHAASRASRLYAMNVIMTAAIVPLGME